MNEMANARSDDPSPARNVGHGNPHNAEFHEKFHESFHVSTDEQLGTHTTAAAAPTAKEHPPIDATTSDFSRCPFFRVLTSATSAFVAQQASLTRAEIAPVETDSMTPHASDPTSRAAPERV